MEGWRIFDLIIVFNENVAAGAVDYVDKRPKENAYQHNPWPENPGT